MAEINKTNLERSEIVATRRAEANKKAQSNKAEAEIAPNESSGDAVVKKDLGSALEAVKARADQQVQAAEQKIENNQNNIDQAKKIVKAQLAKVNELEDAQKANDPEKIATAKRDLEQLQNKRTELNNKIKADNRKQLEDGSTKVQLGRDQKAEIKPQPVKFEDGTKNAQTNNIEETKHLKENLKKDLETLKTQENNLKQVKTSIRGVSNEIKQAISKISENSQAYRQNKINEYSKAKELANEVKGKISDRPYAAVGASASRLNATRVRQLTSD